MISRNFDPVLRAVRNRYKIAVAMPIAGALGNVGYFVRTKKRVYCCGNAEFFVDGVIDAYALLFRLALNYDGGRVLLLVDGDLYKFDPQIYVESESPFMRIKLCLSAGHLMT